VTPVFIIAEAGVNHNGSETLALELVNVAARCGADAVKFQTFSADKLVARGTAKAAYQQRETGDGDQHSMLKSLELSDAAHRRIAERCALRGIEFMSTPFDEDAAHLLLALGMKRIKVPSGEITNLPFLRFLAQQRVPLIVSTGMADMDEIDAAVATVRQTWASTGAALGADALTVLHCTSNYPAAFGDVNLRAMQTIADRIGVPVGYSDHTVGTAVSVAAVARGARVIEKHFTLDRTLTGPDHAASLSPDELADLVAGVRAVEQSLGSEVKAPTAAELPIRALVRRSVTLARDGSAGQTLSNADLTLLRPGTGITPGEIDQVAGRRLRHALPAGHTLSWGDLDTP
jgi:N,N'-diacetyllegionaminate synthase